MSEIDRSIVTAFVTSGRFLASAVELSKHPHITGVIKKNAPKATRNCILNCNGRVQIDVDMGYMVRTNISLPRFFAI